MKTAMDRIRGKGFVGICFPSRNLRVNAKRLFMPASNTKLYSSWLACKVLGEDAFFESMYSIEGRTLYVYPNWNPLLSPASIEKMLDGMGRRQIDRVVIAASYSDQPRHPTTWSISDRDQAWGAPLRTTCFNENYIALTVGASARMRPQNSYYSITFRKGGGVPIVRGRNISLPEDFKGKFEFPVMDPDSFLGNWIAERLGIQDSAVRRARTEGKLVGFGKASLKSVLRVVNKQSCNIMAELLVIHSSRMLGLPLDYDNGIPAFRTYLPKAGVTDAALFDGSGVSRYNLVSPEGTVKLLESCREFPSIMASLPIGGKDGTLKGRKLPSRIRAKTGSIYGVQTLSGYYGDEPFSVMLNHYPGSLEEMTEAIDGMVRDSL